MEAEEEMTPEPEGAQAPPSEGQEDARGRRLDSLLATPLPHYDPACPWTSLLADGLRGPDCFLALEV